MIREAHISDCGRYRYALWRRWPDLAGSRCAGYVLFICLNPSTADAITDDRTSRRCIGFAQAWGYQGVCIVNLFAFRSTDPAWMKAQADPCGPHNNAILLRCAEEAALVVAAWGNDGAHRGRDREVIALIPDLDCLRVTGEDQPSHPLYLPGHLPPIPYTRGGAPAWKP